MGNRILLIGGGGNCKSIIDVILEIDKYTEIGIVDKKPNIVPIKTEKVKYVGNDKDLISLFDSGWKHAFVSIGSVSDPTIRISTYDCLKSIGFTIPNIISKHAIVSPHCVLGEGIFISKGSVVNIGAKIGDCCIINSNCTIEHDCSIGRFVHVAPGAVVCGSVVIGDNSHIGAGSSIKQGITIGENSIIGMGSVVIKNIDSNVVCFGNPCKLVKKNGD